MIRSGVVRAPGLKDQQFQVHLDPLSGCGSCASSTQSDSAGCGLQLLPTQGAPLLLNCQVACESPISRGDRVRVQLAEPDSGWLHIVCMAYGLPTFGMVIGALIGYLIATAAQLHGAEELLSLLGFFAGLTGGLIAWNRAEKSTREWHASQHRVDTATIVGVVPNSGEVI